MMQARTASRAPCSTGHEARVDLVSNAYSLVAVRPSLKVYEYQLEVKPSGICQDLPAKVLGRAYVSRSIRTLLMSSVLPQLSNLPAGSILIEPNFESIFSTQRLGNNQSLQEFAFDNLYVETDLLASLYIDVQIKFSSCFTANPMTFGPKLITAILHHQLQIDMIKYGYAYYTTRETSGSLAGQQQADPQSLSTNSRLDLLSQHLMGISISGARRCSDRQALVVVNSTHTYITKSYPLIDLLASFIAGGPVENVILLHGMNEPSERLRRCQIKEIATIQGNEDWFESFCSILNGFKCQANDSEQKHVNIRFVLTEQPAKEVLVSNNVTVQDFYKRLGVNLNYPNLPCLKSRSSKHPFYPIEMCYLLSGQKVPMFRLSSAARKHLTTVNKPKPFFSWISCQKSKDQIVYINRNQFKSFGIQMSKSPVEACGRILRKPMLQYKNSKLEPTNDYWESSYFCHAIDLINNWCVVDTVGMDTNLIHLFFNDFTLWTRRFGFKLGQPFLLTSSKNELLSQEHCMHDTIWKCDQMAKGNLRLIIFVIDSTSTQLNRLIHLTFDEHPTLTATCIRNESIENRRQHKSIFRTLIHKLNTRLGGTNVAYNADTWYRLGLGGGVDHNLMIVGLDVTHPDNELNGVSIVGCAYTFNRDLFRHRSLVWPQQARVEIITKMDTLMRRLLQEYQNENSGDLPDHLIVYRDGVSHEEFEHVRNSEISKVVAVLEDLSAQQQRRRTQTSPKLSYIIAQKRHTMRFFKLDDKNRVNNPFSGTLIHEGFVASSECDFYLYSSTSPTATARPLHYHVLVNGFGMDNLQKLTYYLCFNFGKCSSSLSMPSSLRYAHNAAYDARNRVIAAREFQENKFYTTKFFC